MIASLLKPFAAGVIVLLLAWGANILLQDKKTYDKTIGPYIIQYQKVNGEMTGPDKAFEKVSNDNLIRWDAVHFRFIRDNHYDQTKTGDYIFVFFPLFPLIWEMSGLSNVGICLLNYLLFITGLILLFRALDISFSKEHFIKYIILLSLPGVVVFFIPYAESVFFITMCLAFYGTLKKKYSLYFLGMMLCSMTRPAAVIIGMAIVSKDIYMFVTTKTFYSLPQKILLNVLPFVVGTLIISVVQFIYDPSQVFHFLNSHKYWNHVLQVPHGLIDWSHEGFSMNVALLFLLVPALIYLLMKNVFVKTEAYDLKNDIFNFSAFYMLGASFFIILYQGGNLHGLFRYVMSTPFFYAFCLIGFERFNKIEGNKKLALFLFTFLPALFTYAFAAYLPEWKFYSMGLFFIFLNFLALFYIQSYEKIAGKIAFVVVLFCNILWNVYLLNCYLNEGWLFT